MHAHRLATFFAALICFAVTACQMQEERSRRDPQKIVATNPKVQDIVVVQPYVCKLRSQQHIEIRALEEGYLEQMNMSEGQAVKKGETMFRVVPTLYQARLEAELAEAQVAEIEYINTKKLGENAVVSQQEVAVYLARLTKARARANLAQAELNFATIKAPFDGIIDRLYHQHGSLVKEKEILTTLSDNSVMWVYFNVPEARYFEHRAREGSEHDVSRLKLVDSRIELILANGKKYDQVADNTVTVEGMVDFETGNYKLRADFPNPDRILRQGQTGTVRVLQTLHNAIVIPQRATFEILDKQFVWVIGEDNVVRQRAITIAHELEDKFVIASGLDAKDRIIMDGVLQVHHGDTLEDYEFEKADSALDHQKYPAE